MVIFFGPGGAGKSVQGQILAARHQWRWLSTGQLFRESDDPKLQEYLKSGQLVSDDTTIDLVDKALHESKDIAHLIMDGFPRNMKQAKWLIDALPEHERSIGVVIVLEVPREQLVERLTRRGRTDDTTEAIEHRLQLYRQEMYPILGYLVDAGVHVAHIDGTGTVGQVHDRVEAEIGSLPMYADRPNAA